MKFNPHITVACIVQRDNSFLFVREIAKDKEVINQPAGHLEANESLIEAAYRETYEETGWRINITGVIGIYLYQAPNGITYQRICFAATALEQDVNAQLSSEIIEPIWLTEQELLKHKALWRSPLLYQCLNDYLQAEQYPLEICKGIFSY